MENISGVVCPSITLVKDDGHIDIAGTQRLWQRLINAGVDGILVFGTIGESSEFDNREKKKLIDAASDFFKGKNAKLIVGCTDTIFDQVLDLASYCEEKGGVDAVISMPPSFFALNKEAVVNHFKRLASQISKGIIIYNFPDRNGFNIGSECIDELHTIDNIIGIKNTIKDVGQTIDLVKKYDSENFTVYAGFDEHYLSTLMAGGSSVISGLVNIIPEVFVKLKSAVETESFSSISHEFNEINEHLRDYGRHHHFVAAIKETLLDNGVISSSVYKGNF